MRKMVSKTLSMQLKLVQREHKRHCLTVQSQGGLVKLTQVRGEEANLINGGRNEKKDIDSASSSSLRCLGFGRRIWSLDGETWKSR